MLTGYTGMWSGRQQENGYGSFDMILALTGGQPGGKAGMVYYSFEIGGKKPSRPVAMLKLESVSNKEVVLKEETFLIEGRGNPTTMTLKLLPSGDLDYRYVSERDRDGNVRTGGGILKRL